MEKSIDLKIMSCGPMIVTTKPRNSAFPVVQKITSTNKIAGCVRGLSQLLHDRMRPKCCAREDIRNLFYDVHMEKMLIYESTHVLKLQ